jgi:hypothetical protein
MAGPLANGTTLDPRANAFYRHTLAILREAQVEFLVGGAFAFGRYTGISRDTKDFDLFVRARDAQRTLGVLARAGYRTELTFPHWLGKAFPGDHFVDIIFDSGNGVAPVDDAWFEHAGAGHVLDVPVLLVPPEEMIWQKSLVQERERFDGADVAHLLRSCADRIDWDRLLARFGEYWRVLFAHLVLFGFIYPGERARIPSAVMRLLVARLEHEIETPVEDDRLCRGTILSRAQYLTDIDEWGYHDARVKPIGRMTTDEVDHWTAAIDGGK